MGRLIPVLIILMLKRLELDNEQLTLMTFRCLTVKNRKAFNVLLTDLYGYERNIDHLEMPTKIALSLEKVDKEKSAQKPSSLSAEEQTAINANLNNALRRYWRVLPGSPASNVTMTVCLEFDESGFFKEESIDLVSCEGGDEKAVRSAFRAAKTVIKRASLQGAFKFPPKKFEHRKVFELEFDPNKMRKR